MTLIESPIDSVHRNLAAGTTTLREVASLALAHAGKGIYIESQPEWTLAEAAALPSRFPDAETRPALYGVPVSLKDCFDLSGFRTSCGSRFYAEKDGIAQHDSWLAEKLRSLGAVITGKTHMQQLAYGITGENRDYGDCFQPRNPSWLTGGSSSGAAASIQEGSAIAAIGTDTGGSIRVPAALCGLAGYRASLGLGNWGGGAHLAPSFDTIGWLFRDLRDAPLLGSALFDISGEPWPVGRTARIGFVGPDFLQGCELEIQQGLQSFCEALHSVQTATFDSAFWKQSFEIFSAIQAHEAAAIHQGYFHEFEPSIAERLAWGASITATEVAILCERHAEFERKMGLLFIDFDFLVAPCSPVVALLAGADQSAARQKILRYTTPASLGGNPVVAVPYAGTGFQLIAAHSDDAKLLSLAATLGEKFALKTSA